MIRVVWKKESQKRVKYYIVAEKQCGDDVLGKKADRKRKLGLNNKKGKKVVVGDANVTEKGFGEEGVVKKISQKCKKSVVGEETGGVKKYGDDGLVEVSLLWPIRIS
ncbi:hypothetical protein Tco_0974061 [Tanacetum coccineum]|uniref:Uncharacterized protein n=1 Tax=Tanacetum coccineum TaxID=301880 RepID=A0ABQ5EAJ3_9ASTR